MSRCKDFSKEVKTLTTFEIFCRVMEFRKAKKAPTSINSLFMAAHVYNDVNGDNDLKDDAREPIKKEILDWLKDAVHQYNRNQVKIAIQYKCCNRPTANGCAFCFDESGLLAISPVDVPIRINDLAR